MRTLLLNLVIATALPACFTSDTPAEPPTTEQRWSITIERARPEATCEQPPGGLDIHVVKDTQGMYRADPGQREHDLIEIVQTPDPEHHAIDLQVYVGDGNGDVEERWTLVLDWQHEDVAFEGVARHEHYALSTGSELCKSVYDVYGYVY